MYGRGTCDDKGGVIAHLSAVEATLQTTKSLPVNVKILFEGTWILIWFVFFVNEIIGEEEIGSVHLKEILEDHMPLLKSDILVLADTGNYDIGVPSIIYRYFSVTNLYLILIMFITVWEEL